MGIKNLSVLIKDLYFDISVKEFAGKRIAIDGNNWMFANMCISRKRIVMNSNAPHEEIDEFKIRKDWLIMCVNFVINLLGLDIVPVIVFDGQNQENKSETQSKRREDKLKMKAQVDDLEKQIKSDELQDPKVLEDLIMNYKKKLSNIAYVTSENRDILKNTLIKIGIPVLQADGDGERLCSSLCTEGKVAALFSTDSDVLVHGAPLTIKGYSKENESCFRCVRLDHVLDKLKLNRSEFVDLCIMCGCDYNSNIPKIGAKKSLKLIQEFKSIDNLKNLKIEILNHMKCRILFSPQSSGIDFKLEIDKEQLNECGEFLNSQNIGFLIESLTQIYFGVSSEHEGTLVDLGMKEIQKYSPPVVKRKFKLV